MTTKIIELSSPIDYCSLYANLPGIERQRILKFNPSIALLEKQLYLLSYRAYISGEYPEGIPRRPAHMGAHWYEDWGSAIFDGTGFAILKFNPKTDTPTILVDKLQSNGIWLHDMRLAKVLKHTFDAKTGNGRCKVLAFYNYLGKQPDKLVNAKVTKRCYKQKRTNADKLGAQENVCVYQEIGIVNCTYNTKKGTLKYTITQKRPICKNFHKEIEKNWSLVHYDGKNTVFQYGMHPWTFLKFNNRTGDACTKINTKNKMNNVFEQIVHYYKNNAFFSGSTPFREFNETELLAVGHLKFKFPKIKNTKSPFYKYVRKIQKKHKLPKKLTDWGHFDDITHYTYIYVMFFYTIDKDTFDLKRFSPAIFIEKGNSNLIFVCGMDHYSNNSYIITYGRDDVGCECMILNQTTVDKLLIHTKPITPSKYQIRSIGGAFKVDNPIKVGIVVHPQIGFDTVLMSQRSSWIEKVPKNRRNLFEDNAFAQSDYSIAEYLKQNYPQLKITIIPADKILTKKYKTIVKQSDLVVYNLVSFMHLYHLHKSKNARKQIDTLLSYKNAWPNFKVQKLFDNKCILYKTMKKHKIPIADTICFNMRKIPPEAITKKLRAKKTWQKLILKPAFGYESQGIEIKNNNTQLLDEMKEYYGNYKKRFDEIVAQKYIPSFAEHDEIRFYFVGEQMHYALLTNFKNKNVVHLVTSVQEASKQGYKYFKQAKHLALKVIKVIKQYYRKTEKMGYMRIDIGCCIHNKVFLNEIELVAGFFTGQLGEELPLIDIKIADQIAIAAIEKIGKGTTPFICTEDYILY